MLLMRESLYFIICISASRHRPSARGSGGVNGQKYWVTPPHPSHPFLSPPTSYIQLGGSGAGPEAAAKRFYARIVSKPKHLRHSGVFCRYNVQHSRCRFDQC